MFVQGLSLAVVFKHSSCGESAFRSSMPASGPLGRIKVQSEGFLLLHPSSVSNDL